MKRLAHLVNPFSAPAGSPAALAQRVTFQSIRAAQRFAEGVVAVELLAACYPEDEPIVPAGFRPTRWLDRSVLDLGTFRRRRRLPVLADLLDRLYESTDAEYVMYSNVDIALMPHFYVAVSRLVQAGHDALVINRRTISMRYREVEDLPLMCAEVGERHEGFDCFVYRRDLYPRFRLGTVCVGVSRVGRTLVCNLVCHAERFRELDDAHLTFHLGNERAWLNEEETDYARHNLEQFLAVCRHLAVEHGPFDPARPLHRAFLVAPARSRRRVGLVRRVASFIARGLRLGRRLAGLSTPVVWTL